MLISFHLLYLSRSTTVYVRDVVA